MNARRLLVIIVDFVDRGGGVRGDLIGQGRLPNWALNRGVG